MAYETVSNPKISRVGGGRPLPTKRERQNGYHVLPPDFEKVIHDFRSSLNIIIGYSELMLDEVMGKMNKEQRASLEDILSSSVGLLDLINDTSIWKDRLPVPQEVIRELSTPFFNRTPAVKHPLS